MRFDHRLDDVSMGWLMHLLFGHPIISTIVLVMPGRLFWSNKDGLERYYKI